MFDDGYPYIIPMNFGYNYIDNRLFLYFHCANEGKKLELISKNPHACFEMDCHHKLITCENACDYTMEYESVIGKGVVEIVRDDKESALSYIMKKYSDKSDFSFNKKYVDAVTILMLEVNSVSGKRLKK